MAIAADSADDYDRDAAEVRPLQREAQADKILDQRPNYVNQASIAAFQASKVKSEKYSSAARVLKLISTIFSIIVAVITILVESNVYKTIFLYCSIYSAGYLISLLLIVTSARQLHYISVKSVGIYGYRVFSVPSAVHQKYFTCIKSISEVSAIPGSSTHSLFLMSNCMQYTLILFAISMKINEWKSRDYENVSATQHIAIYLAFVSNCGVLTVATWNLESNKLSQFMHYSGAACMFFLLSVSFMLYQNISPLSVALLVIQFALAILYVVLILKCPHKHDDRKIVHKISLTCILIEVATCAVSMLVAVLFLWCLDGDVILSIF